MKAAVLAGAAMILFCVAAARAAVQTGAVIDGVVKDEQGAVLPGATVTIRNVDTGFERAVVTESEGRYRLQALPPGTYSLKVELQGFAGQEVRDIVMTIG